MKKIFLLLSSLSLLIYGCESGNTSVPSEVTGKLNNYSNCKSFIDNTIMEIDNNFSAIIYDFNKSASVLEITHVNSAFNCCPGKITADISCVENRITIVEKEKESMCDCNCLYDLDLSINGIEPQLYKIVFEEPYISKDEQIIINLDLKNKSTDTIKFKRTKYPWGI